MKKKSLVRRSRGEKAFLGVLYVIFTLYSLSIIFVLGWAFISSCKGNWDFYQNSLGWPKEWRFENYVEAFTRIEYNGYGYFGMMFNSLWQTFGKIFLSIMASSLMGYIFAKYTFRGKMVMYTVVVTILTLPIMSTGAASYKLIYDLRLNDSPLYLITSLSGYGMDFLIFYAMFKGVSWSYAEASFIDGGGHFYTYFRIMLPMAWPGIFALGINAFISGWNDYMTSLMYLTELPSLAAGLYFFRSVVERQAWDPMYFAGTLISAIVPVTIFIVFQDKIMDKVAFGGLKG